MEEVRTEEQRKKSYHEEKEVKRNLKESSYKSYDELPLFLNAETVAKVLGVSRPAATS